MQMPKEDGGAVARDHEGLPSREWVDVLTMVLDESTDPIFNILEDGTYRYVNQAFSGAFGKSPEAVIGKRIWDIFPKEEAETRMSIVRKAFATGETSVFDVRVPNPAGDLFFITSLKAVRDDEGRVTSVVGVSKDITTRKRLEEASAENLERLRALGEAAFEAIFISEKGLCLEQNRSAEEMFGYSSEEAVGRPGTEWIAPGDRDRVLKHMLAGYELPYEATGLRKDGSTFPAIVRGKMMSYQGRTVRVTSMTDITERKQAEEALREVRQQYENLVASIPIGVYLIRSHPDTTIAFEYVSPRMAELFGLDRDGMLADIQLPFSVIHPDDQDYFIKLNRDGLEHTVPFDWTGRALVRGAVRWLHIQSMPERLGNGDVLWHGIVTDVTERRQAEEALEAGSSALAAVIDHNPMSIQVLDSAGLTVRTNPAFLALFGAIPPPTYSIFSDPILAAQGLNPLFDRIRAGEVVYFPEVAYNVHDQFPELPDCPVWVRTLGFPVLGANGRPERFVLMHENISERRKAEQALRESIELLTLFVHHSPIYTYIKEVTATESRVLQASENFVQMIGVKGSDMVGKTMAQLFPAELAEKILLDDLAVVSSGQALELEEELNGRSYTTLKFPIAVGEKTLLAGFTIDITERKRAEEEKLKLQGQLQQAQKMESLGILAGGVAHDMNNVLAAILGMAELGLEDQPEGSRGFRAFDTIIRAAGRGGKMVKTLLNFARQSPAEERELDMNLILREEVHLLERTTLAKVRLFLDLAPELRPIRGDANALAHAFMNLCVNAVDAMPDNGTLTLRTRNVDDDWIEVLVEDTGTGMPKEVLDRALDPFYTTKDVGKGTGLGLSMVYSTVAAHRGQLDLQSEPGQGTRVRMRFPACEVVAQPDEPGPEPASEAFKARLHVLLVDDDELIQSTLQAVLSSLGHQVMAALTGEEALAKLEAGFQPDVVILDMNMPGLGGSGTLPRLRLMNPTVPVLLATGRADQAALDLADSHPHVVLLSKPFRIQELQQYLANLEPGGTTGTPRQ
jgi:PAS domain S-box-containing protein